MPLNMGWGSKSIEDRINFDPIYGGRVKYFLGTIIFFNDMTLHLKEKSKFTLQIYHTT